MQTLILIAKLFLLQTSIYSFSITDTQGNQTALSNFSGRQILIVNIATKGDRVDQLAELQQLHQQYRDSLIIIGFPSDDFSADTKSNAEIGEFCKSQYGVDFLVASKAPIKGTGLQPIYNWLSSQKENGTMDSEVKGDFQKYLINQEGVLIGVFAGSVSPLSKELTSVIAGNLN
jgi:glutathione peroxidase